MHPGCLKLILILDFIEPLESRESLGTVYQGYVEPLEILNPFVK
jgi:hypothetical protein